MYTNLYFTLQAGDLDEQLYKTNSNYPYIAVVQMDYSINMSLVIEREIVCETKSVLNSIQVLLASYFVFNIVYPKLLGGLFLFFKRYIFKIECRGEKLPTSFSYLCNLL